LTKSYFRRSENREICRQSDDHYNANIDFTVSLFFSLQDLGQQKLLEYIYRRVFNKMQAHNFERFSIIFEKIEYLIYCIRRPNEFKSPQFRFWSLKINCLWGFAVTFYALRIDSAQP